MVEAVHDPIDCQVSQKLLLRCGRELLVLQSVDSPYGDFPGGRVNNSIKNNLSREGLVAEFRREVIEEIGEGVRYELDPAPLGTVLHLNTSGIPIFSVFYEAQYVSGTIELSAEHKSMRWVNVDAYDPTEDRWMKPYEEFIREYLGREK